MLTLYIPVESQARELASRTAVALCALECGFSDVVIGRDVEIFNSLNEAGIVLLKSAASFESDIVDKLIQRGHVVYSLDEEGILPPLNDASINFRFSEKLLDKLSGVFVNGELELASFPDWVRKSSKLIVTGNPRFDFYAPNKRSFYKDNSQKIKGLTGGKNIILLVSRFGDVNLSNNINYFKLLEDNGFINSNETRKFHTGFYEHSKKIFNKFIELPDRLAKEFPESMVVVRPHPSECHDIWSSLDTPSNVLISSEFDIASWLSCSVVMIHNGCTTSIEAAAMEVPVISYVPESSAEFDLVHANELGELAISLEDVINLIRDIGSQSLTSEKLAKLNEIIKYSPSHNASEQIAKELYNGAALVKKDVYLTSKRNFKLSFLFKELIKLTLSAVKLRDCYARKKYPFISTSMFKKKVSNIAECLRLGTYDIKRIGIDVFRIKKNKS